jgi:hypothetical protein
MSDNPDDPNEPCIFLEVGKHPRMAAVKDKFKAIAETE